MPEPNREIWQFSIKFFFFQMAITKPKNTFSSDLEKEKKQKRKAPVKYTIGIFISETVYWVYI